MSSHHRIICLCLVVVVGIKHVESDATCIGLVGSPKKCACTYTDGSTKKQIDFTPLGKTNGEPAFPYTDASDDYKYAYNPCFAFSDQYCQNTAACQLSKDEQHYYPIGDPSIVGYSVDNSDIVLTYGDNGGRVAVVNFHCDESALNSATYTPLGQVGDDYKFTVGTCLACVTDVPNCYGSGSGNSGLTPGGVMCIIFTVLLVVYIVGGILFQRFGRGATGKEMVPNYGFWSDFPLLVKDYANKAAAVHRIMRALNKVVYPIFVLWMLTILLHVLIITLQRGGNY